MQGCWQGRPLQKPMPTFSVQCMLAVQFQYCAFISISISISNSKSNPAKSTTYGSNCPPSGNCDRHIVARDVHREYIYCLHTVWSLLVTVVASGGDHNTTTTTSSNSSSAFERRQHFIDRSSLIDRRFVYMIDRNRSVPSSNAPLFLSTTNLLAPRRQKFHRPQQFQRPHVLLSAALLTQ